MANYPMYNFNPQPMGYQPQMQPYQPQYQPVPQQEQLFCRPVASEEEARGIPVDFSGKPMFFPHLNAGMIYVKAFDQGTGSAVFGRFRRMDEPKPEQQAAVSYAPVSEVEALREYVRKLEQKLNSLTEVNAND